MHRLASHRLDLGLLLALGTLGLAAGATAVAATVSAPCIVDGVFFDDCSDSGLFFPDPGPGGGGVSTELPDLTSLGGFFFQPLSLAAGDPYQANVVVYNLGGLGFNTTEISVGLYLSPVGDDALLPANELAVVDITLPHVTSQFPHPTYVLIPVEGVLPSSVAPGQYRLAVDIDPGEVLDESNEFNNQVAGGQEIAVGGDPDLQPVPDSLDPLGCVEQGATLGLRSRVRNVGGARIEGPVSIAVRYRAVPEGGDELGGTILGTQHVNLVSGQSMGDQQVTVPVLSVPAALAPGDYQIAIDVDFDDAVTERDETNNSGFLGPLQVRSASPAGLPDLAVTTSSYYLGRNPLQVGDVAVIQVDVENVGTTVTPGATFDVRFYASADSTITGADTLLQVLVDAGQDPTISGGQEVPALAAGTETTVTVAVLWPTPEVLTPGSWYLGVIANPTPAFDEITFANNAKAVGKVKTISACHGYATAANAVAMWDLFFTGSGNVHLDDGTVAHFAGEEYCEPLNTLIGDAEYFGLSSSPPPVDLCHFVDVYSQYVFYATEILRSVMHRRCIVTFADLEARPDAIFVLDLENEVKEFKKALAAAKKKCDRVARFPFRFRERRYCSCPNPDYLDFATSGPHPGDFDCVYGF
jgi:hypothetical protein